MKTKTGVIILEDVRADGLMSYLSTAQVEELKDAFLRDLRLSIKLSGMKFLGDREVPESFDALFETCFSEGCSRVLLVSSAAPFLTKKELLEADRILKTCGSIWGPSGNGRYIYGRNALGTGENVLPERKIIERPSDLGGLEKKILSREIFIPSTELFLGTISCVGCGRCLKNCVMLKRNHVDLKALANEESIIDECFLCGTCSDVCLSKIDGKRVVECMRRRRVLEEKTVEKHVSEHVLSGEKTVFFPGCALQKYYPDTLEKLRGVLEARGVETLGGCCFKKVHDLGEYEKADKALQKLVERFSEKEAGEVVFACPSCYYYLREKLPFRCVTIYEKLQEMGFEGRVLGRQGIYIPCPDRKEKCFFKSAESFSEDGFAEMFSKLQCCGGGGGVKASHPDLAEALSQKVNVKFYGRGRVYTLCGECSHNFNQAGKQDASFFLEALAEEIHF